MPIRLQNLTSGFDDSFLSQLPLAEQAMIERGVDPSAFLIAKKALRIDHPLAINTCHHDYTVSVRGQSFTVIQPSDLIFLAYFYERIIAEDEPRPPLMAGKLDSAEGKLAAFVSKLALLFTGGAPST